MIRAFCPALQARRRPAPVNTSSRHTGSGLDLGKSSVSDMCPTPRDSGRTLADQRSVLKVGHKDRLPNNLTEWTKTWSAPCGMDRRDAVQLATCRACSSSNLAGLL